MGQEIKRLDQPQRKTPLLQDVQHFHFKVIKDEKRRVTTMKRRLTRTKRVRVE